MEILKEEPLPPEVPTLVLPNTEDVLKLGDRLDGVKLIILDFPKFTDGRAYTQARLLRERLGYTGELRASGAVLIDQLPFLLRCGFDPSPAPRRASSRRWPRRARCSASSTNPPATAAPPPTNSASSAATPLLLKSLASLRAFLPGEAGEVAR